MAGFDDITKKAQELLKDGKVQDALKSEKAEDVSDKVLGGVADAGRRPRAASTTTRSTPHASRPTSASATSSGRPACVPRRVPAPCPLQAIGRTGRDRPRLTA